MTTRLAFSKQKRLWICGWIAACSMAATAFGAQAPAPRIRADVSSSQMSTLKGSLHAVAQSRFDSGRMPSNSRFTGITMVFNRSAAQQADLLQLLADQQNPASPLYHKWLTPTQFAARFGMAQSDLDKVLLWLQQQGFSIDAVARSRNFIRFSGTVGQIEQAFQTQMHYYTVDGKQHFAPSTVLSVPAAIAPTVQAVRDLSDFRPRSMRIAASPAASLRAQPDFTSSISGSVFFAPGDIATVYNVAPLYSGGYNGAGQSIAIMGQSAIVPSDITNFQNAAGLTPKAPTQVLVPGTGASARSSGDESESDLDLEWSGAMAPGADIFFVYTGNSLNNGGVFDSIIYSVDERIGDILSVSYGACEQVLNGFDLETTFQQAATQGQTVLAASGDSGSTACAPYSSSPQQMALAVNYPASSPYVTGMGGTEISSASSAYSTQGTAYWAAQAGTDVITSALQYIPEVAWNDGSASGLSATGGGVSTLFAKPSYQTTLTLADNQRDVPDISLFSSPARVAYLYCSSDQYAWVTNQSPPQASSCTNGTSFRDTVSGGSYLTAAGGTSFATPVFAGMLALINQAKGYTGGQGQINPALYTLATSGTNTYTAAAGFHDITSGNNFCISGPTYCDSTSGSTTSYNTASGYDLVTGLGSIDLGLLSASWPASSSSLIGTTTTMSASNTSPDVNTNVTFTITVTSDTGTTIPTGTLTLDIDGGTSITGGTTVPNVALDANGTATYTTSFATAATHQVVAIYSGDSTHTASTGISSVAVGGTSSGTGTFSLSATNVTLTQGSSGSSTVTVTPANGYTGTVKFTVSTSSSSLTNACYSISNATVTGTAAVTSSLIFFTSASACAGAGVQGGGGKSLIAGGTRFKIASSRPPAPSSTITQASFSFVALLLAGFLGWRWRKLRALAAILVLATMGYAITGCGGGSSSSSTNAPKGTYNLTVTGADTVTATITASTPVTLTIK